MSNIFIHPQCPMLSGSDMLAGLRNSETIVESDVLESSSYITEDVCALSYNAPSYLQSTKEQNTDGSSFFWCNFCSFGTLSKTSLMEHVTSHRFRCQNCQFSSYSRARIVQHVLLEHHQYTSGFRNFSYCKLVHSKAAESKRNSWHKPCFQETEDGSTEIGDGNKLRLCDVSVRTESNTKSTEDNKIYIHFKKAYFNRPVVDESVSGRNNVDVEVNVNENNIQLPISNSKCISLKTGEEMNIESTETFNDLKKDPTISLTQTKFPVINSILTLVPHATNKPSNERWLGSKSNENSISFQTAKGIRQRYIQPKDRSNDDPESAIRSKQVYPVFSVPTVGNDICSMEPADKWKYYEMAIPHSMTQSANSNSGSVKYIYGDPYDENTNEKFNPSNNSLQIMSESEKIDQCRTIKNTNDFHEYKGAFTKISNNYQNMLDRVIKTEPVDTESQSFISANCDHTVISAAVQYPVNENIQVKKELPDVDEGECLRSSAFGTYPAGEYSAAKRVCQEKEKYDAVNCHNVPCGRSEILRNEDLDSSHIDSSGMLWDCGHCDFKSNDYETCKRHIRSTHLKENNSLLCNEKKIHTAALKQSSIIRDLLEEGTSIKIYSCRTCNYANPSSDAVKKHNKEQHLPSVLAMYNRGEMVFYCPEQCDYMSDSKADYLSHVKSCRGSLIVTGNTKYTSVLQASLMLTLRHIFSNDESSTKRMFMCVCCDFETDVLADITIHTMLHSVTKQVAIKREKCGTRVSWICLKCQIPIKLMQLKKHQCAKVSNMECSDLACGQCHSGKRKSIYVCDQCRYESGCMLMIRDHQSNVCKSGYKELKPDSVSIQEKMHCSRCKSSYVNDENASHVCVGEVKTTAVGSQTKYNTQRVTRSVLKTTSVSYVETTDDRGKDSVNEFTEAKSHASSTTTQPVEFKGKGSRKRKRTGSPKQIQNASLKESAEKMENYISFGEVTSGQATLAGSTYTKSRSDSKSPTGCEQIVVLRTGDYNGHLNGRDTKPSCFNYRSGQRCLTSQDYKHQTSDTKVDNRPVISVLPESGNLSHNSTSDRSRLTTNNEMTNGKEATETEFKPLSMLEWLNTESQRMLKLLKS